MRDHGATRLNAVVPLCLQMGYEGNQILATLPAEEYAKVRAEGRLVELAAGDRMFRPGEPISTVFFPDRGAVAVLNVLETGQNAAVSIMGREGMVGGITVLHIRRMPPWAWMIVQVAATGIVLPSDTFLRLFHEMRALREVTLAHLGRFTIDLARSSVCHRFHSHRQRLARWLVELVRRSGEPSLALTHDAIAQIVGAPRHAVTTALNELRHAGAIDYLRGHISVSDQARLITHACECCQRD